jgi:hypothetical protein
MEKELSLAKIHKKYIKGTKPKALVFGEVFLLVIMTKAVAEAILARGLKVYITTVALKHMYDKKPTEEFDAIKSVILWSRFCG